jgi:hypothetical protein
MESCRFPAVACSVQVFSRQPALHTRGIVEFLVDYFLDRNQMLD